MNWIFSRYAAVSPTDFNAILNDCFIFLIWLWLQFDCHLFQFLQIRFHSLKDLIIGIWFKMAILWHHLIEEHEFQFRLIFCPNNADEKMKRELASSKPEFSLFYYWRSSFDSSLTIFDIFKSIVMKREVFRKQLYFRLFPPIFASRNSSYKTDQAVDFTLTNQWSISEE